MKLKKVLNLSVLFVFLFMTSQQEAKAYLEPSVGSMFIQAIIATVFGLGYAISLYSQKILGFFKKDDNE